MTIGGIYSFIGRLEIDYGAMCKINIGAPGEREVSHEVPWVDPVKQELKRRVKLGQKYQGVKIDRRDGLTITETDGVTDGAKVVLNSKELSFYDVGGGKVLYFDPVSGTYKFMGELNVNDKFVVDKKGDVTVKGNLLLSEESTITWGTKGPVKYKFSETNIADITDKAWHDTMTAKDKYRRDSLDGGTTWGDPYQFKGTDGARGNDGNDALGTWENVRKALSSAAALKESIITIDSVGSPNIYGGNIYGANIYAGDGSGSFAKMDGSGFYMYVDGITRPKFKVIKYGAGDVMQLALGAGNSTARPGQERLFITKGKGVASIQYNGTTGIGSGFTFNSDGSMDVIGELNGVHAVFA